MKEEILSNLDNAKELERLYRSDKTAFRKAFYQIYPDYQDKQIIQIWNERLNFEQEEIFWGTTSEWTFVVVACFIAGLVAKIPQFAVLEEEYFYPRNIAFVVFPFLTAYFAWKQNIRTNRLLIISVILLISIFYINLLPDAEKSDTLILSCIHLPLFLWSILAYTFAGYNLKNHTRLLDFLRFNGDLLVMMAVLLIAGGILTGITLGLFTLIDLNIEEFYFRYVVIMGLAALPIVATFLVQTNPLLVNKVSPVIAKVFTPLVLITLVIYLIAVIGTGKDPYNDREFLMIFNLLLIGVMAIILFSIAETSKNANSKIGIFLLLALSTVTIVVNGIALSAIVFRISEWGITPNRLAVLGGNVLILVNLLLVSYRLLKTIKQGSEIENVEKSITSFLPLYSLWAMLVTFVFPLLFDFK